MVEVIYGPAGDGDEDDERDELEESGEGQDLIEDLIQSQNKMPDMDSFTSAILAEFGGLPGLARELHIEYESSKAGSTNRGYILRSIVDLVKATATRKGAVDPLAGVTAEEMRAAIRRIKEDDAK